VAHQFLTDDQPLADLDDVFRRALAEPADLGGMLGEGGRRKKILCFGGPILIKPRSLLNMVTSDLCW
jgi:hypothetical protein